MIRALLLLLVMLAACDTPGLAFRDRAVTRIAIAGDIFDVRLSGRLAEAIRLNTRYAPRAGPIAARAVAAMTLASGCVVSDLRGDQAVFTGLLACKGVRDPTAPLSVPSGYSCLETRATGTGGRRYAEFDCDPI
ncbi:hypothetical protein [Albibacillus kandeliae]|uniref:hypothetical protein n=1 Tax=Albibacillus kandeliae TaxID=2174228 RepID=UPI0018E545D3|nr:hypothetical protein [Albibacillus kandeliae]